MRDAHDGFTVIHYILGRERKTRDFLKTYDSFRSITTHCIRTRYSYSKTKRMYPGLETTEDTERSRIPCVWIAKTTNNETHQPMYSSSAWTYSCLFVVFICQTISMKSVEKPQEQEHPWGWNRNDDVFFFSIEKRFFFLFLDRASLGKWNCFSDQIFSKSDLFLSEVTIQGVLTKGNENRE